jgi:cell division protein FtsI (penicillin-binding protein 3)
MSRTNKRLALFMGFAIVFLFALLGRTFWVQVVAAPALEKKAEGQSARTVTLDAPRGTIYDRNGEILAMSQATASIYANPKQLAQAKKDPAAVAAQLAPILGVPEEELITKLSSDSMFRYLVRKVDATIGDKVKALHIAGIGVCSEPKRVYPKGALAPQLLGMVGGDEGKGLAGLELQYQDALAGEPGELQMVSDLSGNRLATNSLKEAVPGEDLSLTIDAEIQYETEKVLASVVQEFQAKKACAVVLDPTNGEILAMANTPVFDANLYASKNVQESDRRNMAVTDQYEPGSTFKMVTVAAALEAGIVTPDTKFSLKPTITVYDREVHEAHEDVPSIRDFTVTQILAKSSNVGTVTIGLQVGKTRLVDMIRKFGFTEKVGIDFPGEVDGQMLAPEKWSGTTIANVPIGQGVAVTPLQLAAAYAAIANGGVMVQPHLVKGATGITSRQVVSQRVADQLLQMLRVTVEEGTGKLARVDGYDVAGKTGTAQKVKETGGYYNDHVVASFVGVVPANNPKLVILVTVDDPLTQQFGADVAAPAFAHIAGFCLRRLGIPPTSAN